MKKVSKTAIEGVGRGTVFRVPPEDLKIIGLDTKDGPEHPLHDERIHLPIDQGLVENIIKYGIRMNVEVRKNGDDLEVVDGRQRVRAAREANKRLKAEGSVLILVPTTIAKGNDGFMLGVMISVNENRQNDPLIAKAEKAKRALDFGQPEEDVATMFGVTKKAIQGWMKLLDLHPDVLALVKEKKMAASTAIKLSDLPREEQIIKASEMVSSGNATVAEADRVSREKRGLSRSEESGTKKPGAVLIRKLIDNAANLDLPEDFVLALRWTRGEITTRRIEGLNDAIKKVSAKPKKEGE